MTVDRENPAIEVRPLTPDGWRAIARLFGDNGACGGCWCMWWRVPRGGKLWEEVKGRKNRDSLRRRVRTGKVHAVVAYSDGEPVGWCSFGPRHSFPRLERVRALRRTVPEDTWSIVCFFIPARWRGRGVATVLLRAATDEAFAHGAREIEGYPVVPKTETVPAAFAWTGVPALFRSSGYRKLRRPAETRPIYIRNAE